jgi:hypothetical protein
VGGIPLAGQCEFDGLEKFFVQHEVTQYQNL